MITTQTHSQVAAPLRAGREWSRVGRVVAGLLTAAVKDGKLKKHTHSGRISGYSVWYEGEAETFTAIANEAAFRIDGIRTYSGYTEPELIERMAAATVKHETNQALTDA